MERKIEDIIESLHKAKDPIFRMLGEKGLFQDRGVPVGVVIIAAKSEQILYK